MFEARPTDSVHMWGISLPTCKLNYVMKPTKTYDLVLPLGTYWILYSNISIDHFTIFRVRSNFIKTWRMR